MIRYFSSFIITSILYGTLIGGFLFTFSDTKLQVKEKIEKNRVSLNHIELIKKETPLPKKVEQKKIVQSMPEVIKPSKKEHVKKVESKPKLKNKPKIKKIVKKKKILKKNKVEKKPKEIVKKKIIEKTPEKIVKELTKPLKKEISPNIKKVAINNSQKKVVSESYKKDFLKKNLQLIKKHIQNNVKYSKKAKRMNIQGSVLVEFSLSKEGEITYIKALSGHRLLKKSTIKAIYKAASFFPKVTKNITIKVPIEYKLI